MTGFRERPLVESDDFSDRTFGSAVAAGGFGFILVDVGGIVLGANAPACELVGCGDAELIGKGLTDLVHPDDRGWSEAELELLYVGAVERVRQALRLIAIDGREVCVELTVRPVEASSDTPVGAVVMLEDARNQAQRELELRRLADTDPLTDLYNRRRFGTELDRHLALSERYGAHGALLMADIDGLKRINDAHGHRAGDDAILATATLLRTHLRSSDVIGRIGGDEFAVLLPDCSDKQAAVVARTLLNATRRRGRPGEAVPRTLSIGFATITGPRGTAASLLDAADAAMYQVKRHGGDGYALEGDDHVKSGSQLVVEHIDEHGERARTPALQLVPPGESSVDMKTLLTTIGELGRATRSLAAWELSAEEDELANAWSDAIRHGLLKRVRHDPGEKEWMYQLTRTGQARLQALERDDSQEEDERARPTNNSRLPGGPTHLHSGS